MSGEYDDLLQRMHELTGASLVRARRKALKRVGDEVVKPVMVAKTPVRPDSPKSGTALAPGELRADIRSIVHLAPDDAADNDVDRVTIGPSSKTRHVMRWLEEGHANVKGGYSRLDGNGKRSGPGVVLVEHTPAHPVVRPTQDETASKATVVYEQTMLAAINEVMETGKAA